MSLCFQTPATGSGMTFAWPCRDPSCGHIACLQGCPANLDTPPSRGVQACSRQDQPWRSTRPTPDTMTR
eukprot:11792421-Prorocentrum_lima.AAC.1